MGHRTLLAKRLRLKVARTAQQSQEKTFKKTPLTNEVLVPSYVHNRQKSRRGTHGTGRKDQQIRSTTENMPSEQYSTPINIISNLTLIVPFETRQIQYYLSTTQEKKEWRRMLFARHNAVTFTTVLHTAKYFQYLQNITTIAMLTPCSTSATIGRYGSKTIKRLYTQENSLLHTTNFLPIDHRKHGLLQ